MHGRRLLLLLVVVTLTILGCAAAGTSTYHIAPPTEMKPQNEVVIDAPFEKVWDHLVGQLSKSFYVINNIDKASRIINVSFTSDTPELYVDCGHTRRTYTYGGASEEFDYDVAASSSYKAASKASTGNPITSYIDRKTSLDGRANVYVAPEGSGTRISVNARYILTIQIGGHYESHALIGPASATYPLTPSTSTISFNTAEPVTKNIGTAGNPVNVTCRTTGKLESDVLNFAK